MMAERGSKFIRHMFWGLCVALAVGIFLGLSPVKAEAASTKSKALKAYREFLAKKTVAWDKNWKVDAKDCKFALAYIDADNVPELVLYAPTVTHAAGFGRLYAYVKGKVSRVGAVNIDDKKFRYYKKSGIYISRYVGGGVFDEYIKLSKGKLALKLLKKKYVYIDHSEVAYANSKDKEITKSKFNKALKKLVGSKKMVTIKKFYNNTAANRKKYCK